MRLFLALILINALTFGSAVAQPDTVKVKVSKDKVKISGKMYYVHTVRSGETLYSIAKAYQVAQAAVIESNPEIYQGVKVGNTIKIPVVQELKNPNANKELYHVVKKGETLYSIAKQYNVAVDELSKINILNNGKVQENQVLYITAGAKAKASAVSAAPVVNAIAQSTPSSKMGANHASLHSVQAKETLFSIAKRYNVTVTDLEEANPFLKEQGLQIGQTLSIPEAKFKAETSTPSVASKPVRVADCPPYVYSSRTQLNVVLMLPLTIGSTTNDTTGADYRRADDILQYYEGTLLAVDSLKKQGVSINLTVIDTKNDKDDAAIDNALKNPALKNANLIIGPVYSNAIAKVAAFAEAKGIPMVSPLAASAKIIKENPYFIQIATDAEVLNKHSIELTKNRGDEETVLVIPASEMESKNVKTFKAMLGEKFPELVYTAGRNAAAQREMLKSKLKPGVNNRFVVLSNNEVFVLDFLQNLTIAAKDYQVEVLGNSRWLKFNSIDMQYIHGSNVEMYVNNYVDYNDAAAKTFVGKFRNYFKAEPNNYAFRGFDVGYFFIDALKQYGPEFISCLTNIKANNLHTPFNFVKVGENGGFQNDDAVLIRHIQGYQVIKVK